MRQPQAGWLDCWWQPAPCCRPACHCMTSCCTSLLQLILFVQVVCQAGLLAADVAMSSVVSVFGNQTAQTQHPANSSMLLILSIVRHWITMSYWMNLTCCNRRIASWLHWVCQRFEGAEACSCSHVWHQQRSSQAIKRRPSARTSRRSLSSCIQERWV